MRYLRNITTGTGILCVVSLFTCIQWDFPRNLQHSIQMLEATKRNLNVHFKFANAGHTSHTCTYRLTVILTTKGQS